MIFKDIGLRDMPDMMAMFKRFGSVLQEGCRRTLQNKEFLKWLEAEKFDVAYAYIYSTCPIGIIHVAKIPSWIWLNSGPLMDYVAQTIGVPTIPSYIPPVMMESADEMGFYFRMKSLIGHTLTGLMHRKWVNIHWELLFWKKKFWKKIWDGALFEIHQYFRIVNFFFQFFFGIYSHSISYYH